ncbi:MAG: hypothetical protein V7K67_19620 [Nostoc sp.]
MIVLQLLLLLECSSYSHPSSRYGLYRSKALVTGGDRTQTLK